MTNHDPAIEAAQRVIELHEGGVLAMADIAREALKPIRELHKSIDYFNGDDGSYEFTCAHCDVLWPCATAKLVYSAEELES